MSRYLESMRTRLEKLIEKIRPLEQEKNDLLEAIAIFEKKEATESTPKAADAPASDTQATQPEVEPQGKPPAFLKHKHETQPA